MGISSHSEFKHSWALLLITLIGTTTSASYIPLYSFGPLAQDLSTALNVSLSDIQKIITFNFVGIAIGSQLAGWLVERYNSRHIILWSLLFYAASYTLLGTVELYTTIVYLLYFLIPIVGCGALIVSWTHLVCQRFEKQRGLALAITLSGSGVASTLAPLLLSMVVGTEHWQQGFYILAALPALTLVICFFALPKPSKRKPVTEKHRPRETSHLAPGISYLQALKTRHLWTMLASFTLVAFVIVTMITNAVPILVHKGLNQSQATMLFSVFGVSLIIGRLSSGYFLDRYSGPVVAFIALLLPTLGCLIFYLTSTNTGLMVLAIGLVGAAAGAEFDILAYLVSRYFGLRAYAKIFGALSGTITLGSGMSPFIYGPILDSAGGYSTLLLVCAIAAAFGSSLMLSLGAYPQFPSLKTGS